MRRPMMMATVLAATAAVAVLLGVPAAGAAHWAHSADLDRNFVVYWTPGQDDITFEVQVRTLGYVGFGFSPEGKMRSADMVIGWVRNDKVVFQDRHALGQYEPEEDASQDYELLQGYENGTHTVLRFRRKYDTCDPHDFRITNDTIRLLFAYNADDPPASGPFPYHGSQRGSRSLFLLQRASRRMLPLVNAQRTDLQVWDLRNPAVVIGNNEDTLYWCKVFKLPVMKRKHHLVRYEPIQQSGNRGYLHHVIVYECQGNPDALERHAAERGYVCYQPSMPPELEDCHNVVATWAIGSEGFSFPAEAGYPLDPETGPRYIMMETHYSKPLSEPPVTDSSGLRLFYTSSLRAHDAGVLSVGLDPNWRHIIPPGRAAVVSEGHCISNCTKQALPKTGISVFATILHTHLIGRRVRLRHIRGEEELSPITVDNSYDFNYQEYRRLDKPAKIYPGDHLIAECTYNSVGRSTITLGGLTAREEMCVVFALYYPRTDLSLCYSLPSLPTVLHSLGIQELMMGSSPVKILSPPELKDMTLETRLTTYDWENNFGAFQEATRKGSFKPLCWAKKPAFLPEIGEEAFYPNITKPWIPEATCNQGNHRRRPHRKKKPGDLDDVSSPNDQNETVSTSEARNNHDNDVSNRLDAQEQSRLNRGPLERGSACFVLICVCLSLLR